MSRVSCTFFPRAWTYRATQTGDVAACSPRKKGRTTAARSPQERHTFCLVRKRVIMRIVCFGSGPACFLLGLAVKRKQNVHDVTILQGTPSPERELGVALPRDPRQNTTMQIEALLGKCLPLHRWSDTEVFQRGARTSIEGASANGILLRPLLEMLKDAAKAAGCAIEPAESFDEADLSGFDVVVVEGTSASRFRERFDVNVRTAANQIDFVPGVSPCGRPCDRGCRNGRSHLLWTGLRRFRWTSRLLCRSDGASLGKPASSRCRSGGGGKVLSPAHFRNR